MGCARTKKGFGWISFLASQTFIRGDLFEKSDRISPCDDEAKGFSKTKHPTNTFHCFWPWFWPLVLCLFQIRAEFVKAGTQ
jgi:hypothetical protein